MGNEEAAQALALRLLQLVDELIESVPERVPGLAEEAGAVWQALQDLQSAAPTRDPGDRHRTFARFHIANTLLRTGGLPQTDMDDADDTEEEAGDDGDEPGNTSSVRDRAWSALDQGDLAGAESLAGEALALAVTLGSWHWDTGNLIHHGHLVLGHVKLQRGDMDGAGAELREAGKTPGSPQLNSYGPNMSLADELLHREGDEVVLAFLGDCSRFWDPRFSRVSNWEASIRVGEIPDLDRWLKLGTGKNRIRSDGH